MFDRSKRSSGGDAISGSSAGPSPGKRTRTSRLPVQRKPVQKSATAPAPDGAEAQEIAARGIAGSGKQLPHQGAIQQAFGHHDVSGIAAHVGGDAARSTEHLDAAAFAIGNDVAFADSPDLHTAAHEAAHVVQQRGGVQLAGGVGRDGDAYEQHADRVADLVVGGQSAESTLDEMAGGSGGAAAVQRKSKDKDGDADQIGGRIVRMISTEGGTKISINRGSAQGIEPGWKVQLSDGGTFDIVQVEAAMCHAIVNLSMDAVRALDSHVSFTREKKSRKQKKLEKKAITVKIDDVKGLGVSTCKVHIKRGMDDGFNYYWKVEYLNDDGSPRVDGKVVTVDDNGAWIELGLSYEVVINSSRTVRLIPYH